MRSARYGFHEIMTSNYVGACDMNDGMTQCNLKKLSIRQRYNYLFSIKGKAGIQWIYFQWSFFPWRVPLVITKMIMQLVFGIKE